MYRTNNFGWKLTHVLCILAHLGLIVAAAVTYVYNVSKDTQTEDLTRLSKLASLNLNADFYLNSNTNSNSNSNPNSNSNHEPCNIALMSTFMSILNSGPLDGMLRTLLTCCMVVGALGLIANIGLFAVLLRAEESEASLTEGEQHWRKQTITFFSCVFNLLLAGAGVGLAGAMGIKVPGSKSLITPLVWASIQAPLALITALFDTIKNHRDGKDLLD
ncbi:hypothetical protein B0T25DRAFT_574893 [Lasiosphaeria hispida]|uniref:Uncharacterized protein n=1 Tax=Lasiosphaeria hispida TaxID=260671 RepID=A0AAJ0M7Z4_9PEZI|nr:hypothetical protein B0T25DRAFT_574893 [Lasiosphaeria hispida]